MKVWEAVIFQSKNKKDEHQNGGRGGGKNVLRRSLNLVGLTVVSDFSNRNRKREHFRALSRKCMIVMVLLTTTFSSKSGVYLLKKIILLKVP